jgi:hypothetical protein
VAQLVAQEEAQILDQLRRAPARHRDLAAINANRAVFARVIDLHHQPAKRASGGRAFTGDAIGSMAPIIV